MKLYSAVRYTSTGSAYHHSQPRLVADNGAITSVGDLQWADYRAQFEQLTEGTSSVVTPQISNPTIIVNASWRVTRLPDFKQGQVLFDEHAKEFVRVSNGKCVLNHESPERYKEAHGTGDCIYAPSEAIALRVIIQDGKPLIAWTYRAVDPCSLSPVEPRVAQQIAEQFSFALNSATDRRTKASKTFIGRI